MDGKKNRTQILTLVLCALLLALSLWQLRQISDLRGQLRSVETNLQMETRRLDERVQAVQRAAQEAGAAVLDWEYTTAVNKEQRVLDVTVDLSLKEWSVDTAVWVNWTSLPDGKTGSEPLRGGKSGHLTGTLKLPVGGRREYALEAVIQNGESQRLEELGCLGDTAGLLPVQCGGWGSGGPVYEKDTDQSGTVRLSHCEAELYSKGQALSGTRDHAFRLRLNGELAAEQAAAADRPDSYVLEGELSALVRSGDELALTFFCRDASGLGYEFFLRGWSIEEGGVGTQIPQDAGWPRLTWD